jgi:hypothetical protein
MSNFREAISQVIRDFKPALNYEELNSKQLLYCLVKLRALGRDTLARVILVGWPDADLKAVAEETADLSDNLSWEYIDRLCELCQSPVPAMLLVAYGLEQDAIFKETNERLKRSKVGAELLRLYGDKVKPKDLRELHKALKIEKITTYRPQKESDEDLKGIAVEGATTAFKQIGQTARVDMPEGPYPLTPLAEALPVELALWKKWERVNGAMERKDFALMQEYFLPALQGKKISERARQTLRDHFEAQRAKKRMAETLSLDGAEKDAILPPWETSSGNISYLDARKAYKIVRERYGQKGHQFLDALKETGNVKEASASAGISRQMGHRYLVEIRKKLTPTKK